MKRINIISLILSASLLLSCSSNNSDSSNNKGKLKIESNPSDAKVYIAGEYKGNTPLELEVRSGEPTEIHLKKGNLGYIDTIQVVKDVTQTIQAGLGLREEKINTQWQKTFGGSASDYANSIVSMIDRGSVVAGYYTEDLFAEASSCWVIRMDGQGNELWRKTFRGSGSDSDGANSIVTTVDGGFAVAGWTLREGISGNDFCVIRMNGQGNEQWQKTFNGSESDGAHSIVSTIDGGFVIAGYTVSYGSDDYGSRGYDFWIISIDGQGNEQWRKTFGGSEDDVAHSIVTTVDEGLAVAGYTESYGAGSKDLWVIRMDGQGNEQWQKTFGGSKDDWARSIVSTADGGFTVAGYTESHGAGGTDLWVIRMDGQGNEQWQKTFGGSEDDWARSIVSTADGGFAVAGGTRSYGAGDSDFWVLRLDGQGNEQWRKTFGGNGSDVAHSIVSTADGGFVVAGDTESYGAGNKDFWVLKIKHDPAAPSSYAKASFDKN